MENNTKKRSKAGLVVLIILLILIGIPILIVVLLQPGTAQWNRITAVESGLTASESELSSTNIILQESWLNQRISEALLLVNEESPDFQIAGSKLSLEKNRVSFIVGAVLKNPLSPKGKTIKAAVETSMSASIGNTRELVVKLESIKIGRLPLPVKLLTKIQAVKSSLNTDNLLRGRDAEFDLETMSFKVNLDELMKEISPGSRIQNFQILDEKVSIALSLSPELNQEIQEMARLIQAKAPDVHLTITGNLPADKTGKLKQAEHLFKELAEQKETKAQATLSYMEGDVSSVSGGVERLLDFGDILEEGSSVMTGKASYAELVLPGSSILKILEESELLILSSQQEGQIEDNRIELAGGKIRALVESLDSEEDVFLIQAGATTMGVRGTDFTVAYEGSIELIVLEGAVSMENEKSMALLTENQRVRAKDKGKLEPLSLSSAEREDLLEEIPVFTDTKTVESLFSYNSAPALMELVSIYTDFWFSLSPEEQEELEWLMERYIEENPELMRDISLFLEEQGWTEENLNTVTD